MRRLLTQFSIAALLFTPPFALCEDTAKSNVPSALSTGFLDEKAFDDSFGKLPTNITSDNLTFNAKNRIFTYQGNVQVTQGDMRLTAKTLEGTYSEQNQLLKLIAKGDVLITKQDIKASGQVASYDAVTSIVTLSDNPELQQQESVLRADRIKIFLNENRSQAEGDVRVTFVNKKEEGGKPGAQPAASPAPTTAGVTTTPAPATTTAKATPTPTPTPKATPKKTTSKKKTTSAKKSSSKKSSSKK